MLEKILFYQGELSRMKLGLQIWAVCLKFACGPLVGIVQNCSV